MYNDRNIPAVNVKHNRVNETRALYEVKARRIFPKKKLYHQHSSRSQRTLR